MAIKAGQKTESNDRKNTSYQFEDQLVRAGTKKAIEVPVARLPSGTQECLPVVIVHGLYPGPTTWINGAIHGDELNGIEIVRRLLQQIDPRKLSGTIIAVPIVNVFGVTIGSRYLPDRRDLNRCFPGSPRGSLAARLSHFFLEKVVSRCEVGLDFHTGSNGRANLPQIRADMDDLEARRLADIFHPPLILHSNIRDGSLRSAAGKKGISVLVFEGGEASRFDPSAIETGIAGGLRIFKTLGMIDNAPAPDVKKPWVAKTSRWARAGRSGFCRLLVDLGDVVQAGDTIATISDSLGKEVPCRSPVGGLALGILRTALVHRGDAIVHIAEVNS